MIFIPLNSGKNTSIIASIFSVNVTSVLKFLQALFTSAFTAAKTIVSCDPELETEENQGLRAELERYLAPRASIIS